MIWYRRLVWILYLSAGLLLFIVMVPSIIRENLAQLYTLKASGCSPYVYSISYDLCAVIGKEPSPLETPWDFELIKGAPDSSIRLVRKELDSSSAVTRPTTSITLTSKHDLTWLAIGEVFYKQGKKDQAIETWRHVPDISQFLVNQSKNTQNLGLSRELLELSLEVKPTGVGYYELGIILNKLGKEAESLTAFENALSLNASEKDYDLLSKTYIMMGDIFLRQKRGELAVYSYLEAQKILIELLPGTYLNLSRSYFLIRRYDEARVVLKDLLSRDSELARGWWWLGEVEWKRGDRGAAIDAYRRYRQLRPDDVLVLKRLKGLGVEE